MARSVCPETRLVVQVALGCLSVWLQKIQRSPCCVRWVRCILACDATGLGWVTQPGRQMWHIIKWTLSDTWINTCVKWHLTFQIQFVVCSSFVLLQVHQSASFFRLLVRKTEGDTLECFDKTGTNFKKSNKCWHVVHNWIGGCTSLKANQWEIPSQNYNLIGKLR